MSPCRAPVRPSSVRRPLLALALASAAAAVTAPEAVARSAGAPSATRGDTTGAIRGVAMDSLLGGPLADAAVSVAALGTSGSPAAPHATARTDSLGRFVVGGLAPGTWRVTLTHPALDSAGLWDGVAATATVARGGDTVAVQVATPSATALRQRLCLGQTMDLPVARDSAATGRVARVREVLLYGAVRDATTEALRPGAAVAVRWVGGIDESAPLRTGTWEARPRWLEAEGIADAAGVWAVCLRGDAALLDDFVVEASAADPADGPAGARSGRLRIAAGSRGVRRIDLAVAATMADTAAAGVATVDAAPASVSPAATARDTTPASATRPALRPVRTARLEGLVVDTLGAPVPNARITLGDAADEGMAPDSTVSGADGRFRLATARVGTQPLTVRALGFGVWSEPVVLVPWRSVAVTVAMPRVNRLPRVVVRDTPWRAWLHRSIEKRRREHIGVFVDSTYFAQFAGAQLNESFAGLGGLVPDGQCGGNLTFDLRGQMGIRPKVVVDDMISRPAMGGIFHHCDLRPEDIGYVEYYRQEIDIPLRYRAYSPAVILVWTKGYLADPKRGTWLARLPERQAAREATRR